MSRPHLEISALIVTGLLFQLAENVLDVKVPYLVTVTLLWAAYVVWRLWRVPGTAREWGLGWTGFRRTSVLCGWVLLAGVVLMGSYRVAAGFQPLPASSIWIFLGYPIWSMIQEFAVQALIVVNLEKLGAKRAILIPVAAVLFGLAHFPDLPLMGLCAGVGLIWAWIFLRGRNLYPIALCHAWLGTLAFYWLLERDPVTEMVPV